MVQTLPDGDFLASGRRRKRAVNLHNFRPVLAGNEEPMTHFFVGVFVGFIGGGCGAYYAFNAITRKMARMILEGDEICHR
jgi:hypothetical protein